MTDQSISVKIIYLLYINGMIDQSISVKIIYLIGE